MIWDELQSALDALQREVTRRNADDPNFWDGASLADLALTRLLLESATPRRRGSAVDEGAAQVLAAYRDAVGGAASPREVASLAENIVFLGELWPARDKAVHRILEQIREGLQ